MGDKGKPGTLTALGEEIVADQNRRAELSETQVAEAQAAAKENPGKPCERLTLTVEFFQPMDHAALGELIEAVKLYGTVASATHQVLRRSKRALV